jgi:hypothetical protein
MRQADAHCEAGEGPRARSFGRSFYFMFRLRVLREAVRRRLLALKILLSHSEIPGMLQRVRFSIARCGFFTQREVGAFGESGKIRGPERVRSPSFKVICPRMARASLAGSAAAVIGRPTTM